MYKLVSDFHQKKSDKMHYKELAAGDKHFKEIEEGHEIMCESIEKYGTKKETRAQRTLITKQLQK